MTTCSSPVRLGLAPIEVEISRMMATMAGSTAAEDGLALADSRWIDESTTTRIRIRNPRHALLRCCNALRTEATGAHRIRSCPVGQVPDGQSGRKNMYEGDARTVPGDRFFPGTGMPDALTAPVL